MRRVPIIAVFALALLASPAAAKCKHHSGMLASKFGDTVWHTGSTLYGCEGQNASLPPEKLGKWAPGTKVKLGYYIVVWTVPGGSGSKRYDRVYAKSVVIGSGWPSWLSNHRAVPAGASTPARDARIESLLVTYSGLAWVTTRGDVVLAVRQPTEGRRPEPIGDLTTKLKARGNTVLVGRWSRGSAADLAKSAKFLITSAPAGCEDAGDKYTLTLKPPGQTARVGVRWFDSSWFVDCP